MQTMVPYKCTYYIRSQTICMSGIRTTKFQLRNPPRLIHWWARCLFNTYSSYVTQSVSFYPCIQSKMQTMVLYILYTYCINCIPTVYTVYLLYTQSNYEFAFLTIGIQYNTNDFQSQTMSTIGIT
uniref:Uncharacterized protein n=1 Tax=Cacopsylla melanoneura TaxID=428564 RepID=A0A8D8QKU3_9HEMI